MASRIRTSVRQKIRASRFGESPSNNPETTAARKQLVPVPDNQLKSYRAGSGVGLATTGSER